ncbi:uncharacterized protein [Parasteatoda tepidariorum]|uniref:uncharacterized protein n=1 Tax=Parasteatoda tepidariorum TaxID=114398 RepID=UPI0039BC5B41
MVKLIKTLLRKVLGRSSLNHEELQSVLIGCEGTVNSKSLTYVSEDSYDLIPLTPALFLVMRPSKVKGNQRIAVGDIVPIETEGEKKVLWPMGRVTETYVGKDGHIRVARLKASTGELVRPVQRIFPLEMSCPVDIAESPEGNVSVTDSSTRRVITRSCRTVKIPTRFFN